MVLTALSQVTGILEVGSGAIVRKEIPVHVAIGQIWEIHTVVFTTDHDVKMNMAISHNLTRTVPTTLARFFEDEDIWCFAGTGNTVIPVPRYEIAGPQSFLVANGGGGGAGVAGVTLYYTVKRVSKGYWTWLRANRSRETS